MDRPSNVGSCQIEAHDGMTKGGERGRRGGGETGERRVGEQLLLHYCQLLTYL